MKRFKLLLLTLLSGLLLGLSWPYTGSLTTLIFIAFIPLLWVEMELSERNKSALRVFLHAYLSFFVFNLITTWWIKNADMMGAVMANVCNAFFMSTIFWLFHLTKKWVGKKEGYIALLIYWIAFEYLHLNWELSWSWLTLGNAFAISIKQIQWYEFTGVLGGSLWVLIVNILTFLLIRSYIYAQKLNVRMLIMILFIFFIPKALSYQMFNSYEEKGNELEFVIVQPNIDPYNEKFNGLSPEEQVDKMIALAKQKLTKTTDYLVLPETALPEAMWERDIAFSYGYKSFQDLTKQYENLQVIIGLSSSIMYTPGMEKSSTARDFAGDGRAWYDNYNTAIQIDETESIPIHHKSKLVLGVEKLPFANSLPFMKKLSINLGGTSGGLGYSERPTNFNSEKSDVILAPIICYESIFGEYVNQYVHQGANIFAIITNDGWWDDTPGYKQHLSYASLRAIENRRSIARSANTGTSAFINQKGEISQATKWWEPAVISGKLTGNERKTIYNAYGDFIGRSLAFIAPLLLLLAVVKKMNKTAARLNLKKQ